MTKVSATAATAPDADDLPQVEAWRLEQLLAAGYHAIDAELIALRHDIDLHVACDLIASGCRSAIAADILL